MLKALFLTISITAIASYPALAQGWGDAAGTGDTSGNDSASYKSNQSQKTKKQNQELNLSQTSTGAPLTFFGANTFMAPANLALKTQGSGMQLPETTLDSFVHKAKQSGMAEFIYGDEGTTDKPPYDFFMEINTGIQSSDLTTGHKSDAPSAWGTPLKYNSQGGQIKGE